MIFTKAERRTTILALLGAAGILIVYYVGIPLWNKWTSLGDVLQPKLQYIDRLRERAAAQNALLARRDELSRKLGAVVGRGPQAPKSGPSAAPATGSSSLTPGPGNPSPPVAASLANTSVAASASAPDAGGASAKPPQAPGPSDPESSGRTGTTGQDASASKRPASPPSVSVAAYVERMANAAGIRLNSIMPMTPSRAYKSGKSLVAVGLQVNMEAATPSFLKLLHSLEKGDRLIRIEQMDIRHDIKKGATVVATLQVVGYEAAAR